MGSVSGTRFCISSDWTDWSRFPSLTFLSSIKFGVWGFKLANCSVRCLLLSPPSLSKVGYLKSYGLDMISQRCRVVLSGPLAGKTGSILFTFWHFLGKGEKIHLNKINRKLTICKEKNTAILKAAGLMNHIFFIVLYLSLIVYNAYLPSLSSKWSTFDVKKK